MHACKGPVPFIPKLHITRVKCDIARDFMSRKMYFHEPEASENKA